MNGQTAILDQLRAAFPAQPIDATDAFAEWGKTYPDARAFRDQLDGRTWDQLDRAFIARRADALGFLGTRHLVATLPLYLASLVEDGVWSPAAGIVALILAKPTRGTAFALGSERFDALVDALTPAQRTVVALVLRAFAGLNEDAPAGAAARSALVGYWKVYLPDDRYPL